MNDLSQNSGYIYNDTSIVVRALIVVLRIDAGIESSTVVFLAVARHFIFTSSDIFAVGCIVQPQT